MNATSNRTADKPSADKSPVDRDSYDRRSTTRYAWLVAGVTFLVFAPSIGHEFLLLDDTYNVYLNPHLHPVTWENFLHFWTHSYERNYVPIVYTMHTIEMLLWGDESAAGYRLVNIVLHLAATLLLFGLLRRLNIGPKSAALGALVFAIHPMQIESVVWITGRWAVLAGALTLWSAYAYVRWVEKPTWSRYALVMLALVLGLLAKPSTACVPLMLFCVDWFVLKRPLGRVIVSLVPLFAVSGLFILGLLVANIQPTEELSYVPSVWLRFVVAGDALAFYLYKFFLPIGLVPDYGRSPTYVLQIQSWWWAYASTVFVAGILIGLWVGTGRSRWTAAAGLFVAGVFPTLGFVPFMFQEYTTVADRYAYLSLTGPALAVAWFLTTTKWKPATALCGILLAGFGLCTMIQARYWSDSETFCAHALRINPRSCMMQGLYGNVLAEQDRLTEAVAHYEEALRIRPKYPEAFNNLGLSLVRLKRIDEAVEQFEKAIAYRPEFWLAHANLAAALYLKGDVDRAIEHDELALTGLPANPDIHKNLGQALMKQDRLDEAIHHFTESLRLRPDDAALHTTVGTLWYGMKKFSRAASRYREAVRLDPHNPEPANHLAWVLATAKNDSLRNGTEAVRWAEHAADLTERNDASILDTLAVAYAEAGRFTDAVATAELAVKKADQNGKTELADLIRKRLERFRAGQPFRE